ANLPDADFDRAAKAILAAGMSVTGFGSQIGNWSRHIMDDFGQDVRELRTAMPRMRRVGARFIRTMSWKGDGVDEAVWRKETLRRYRELTRIAADSGIVLAHENCTGWGGLSAANMRALIEEID